MPASEPKTVTIEHQGRTWTGSYTVSYKRRGSGSSITVSTAAGSKFALLYNSPPDVLARIMLRELVDEGKG